MAWFGSWNGAAASGARQAPRPAAVSDQSILDKVLETLDAEFPAGADLPAVYATAAPGPEECVIVTRVAAQVFQGTQQELRITLSLVCQALTVEGAKDLHARAVDALDAARILRIVSRAPAQDSYDGDIGAEGMYQRYSTMEIRG